MDIYHRLKTFCQKPITMANLSQAEAEPIQSIESKPNQRKSKDPQTSPLKPQKSNAQNPQPNSEKKRKNNKK